MLLVTAYNLFAVIAYHSLFSLAGFALGVLILSYMWLELDKKGKEYKRYYG